MSSRRQQHVIQEAKQFSVLAAAPRQELLDVLACMGTVSVAEIGAALGRPADALYFHLRALKRAGLVQQVGYRTRSGRREALFRTVAPELRLRYQPRKAANRRAVTAIVSSMLRLGIRDFRRAFERADAVVSGNQRELWALRKTGRLSPAQIKDVNRLIERLTRNLSRPNGRGRLYGITVLLTPLDHRSRRKGNSSSQGARARK
ncbi:MAG: helix-turn-helix transcriptional regulator [Acidobacteria bacterium]|nr:helix-turn-helix transcriptional regulator [Acidobacteriota bacterium]MBV9625685.1 helix-turn-helix transcriptional regulator [Acidobacteriota bacterium]